jgi:hypothetical protein
MGTQHTSIFASWTLVGIIFLRLLYSVKLGTTQMHPSFTLGACHPIIALSNLSTITFIKTIIILTHLHGHERAIVWFYKDMANVFIVVVSVCSPTKLGWDEK